jgi:hypothetical protein
MTFIEEIEKIIPISEKIITNDNLVNLIETIKSECQKEDNICSPLVEKKERVKNKIDEIEKEINENNVLVKKLENLEDILAKNEKLYSDLKSLNISQFEIEKEISKHNYKIEFELEKGNEIITTTDVDTAKRTINNEKLSQIQISFGGRVNKTKRLIIKFEHQMRCFGGNYISILGKDEEWVRATYDLLKNITNLWKNQFPFRKYSWLIGFSLYMIPIFIFIMVFTYGKNLSFYSVIFLFVLFIITIFLPIFILDKISNLFPCVELQTGPAYLHFEETKRNALITIFLAIILPIIFTIVTIII